MNLELKYKAMANVQCLSNVVTGLRACIASEVFNQFNGKKVNARLTNAFKALAGEEDKWYIVKEELMFKSSRETSIRFNLNGRDRSINVKERDYDRAIYAECDKAYISADLPEDDRLNGESLKKAFQDALTRAEDRIAEDKDLIANWDFYVKEAERLGGKMKELYDAYDKFPSTFRQGVKLTNFI